MDLSRPGIGRGLVVLAVLGLGFVYFVGVSLPALLVLLTLFGSPLLAGYVYVAEPANIPISHRVAGWLFVLTIVVVIAVFLYIAQPGYMGPMIAG